VGEKAINEMGKFDFLSPLIERGRTQLPLTRKKRVRKQITRVKSVNHDDKNIIETWFYTTRCVPGPVTPDEVAIIRYRKGVKPPTNAKKLAAEMRQYEIIKKVLCECEGQESVAQIAHKISAAFSRNPKLMPGERNLYIIVSTLSDPEGWKRELQNANLNI
jgi:hypothetical protein